MYKKTIKYVDYNGTERVEDFRFNLNESEIMEMEASLNGGLTQYMERIVAEQDTNQIMEVFKNIIMKAYGVKSLDGKRFEKSDEISRAFVQTEAYNVLFMELLRDAQSASDFMNGIVPQVKTDSPVENATALPKA